MENAKPNIKNIINADKFVVVFLIFIIGAVISFIIIFVPAVRNLGNLKTQLKAQSLKLEEIKREIASSGKTKSRIVTNPEDIAQALDEITKKSAQLNFKFDSIKQGEPFAIGGNFKILPITIESTCSFQALSGFVAALENLRRSVVVVKKLEVGKDKINPRNLKVSLELGMYLLI
jgi:Tfp pilus assembly protein PilO